MVIRMIRKSGHSEVSERDISECPDFCFKEIKQMPDIYLYRDKKISILKKEIHL